MSLNEQGLRLSLVGPLPSSSKLNLTIKNKEETNYVKHSTNWETSLNSADFKSKAFFNDFAAHSISFTAADFSEHKFDFNNNPFVYVEQKHLEQYRPMLDRRLSTFNTVLYQFESEWNPNDIAMLDDLTIVATQDYCSTDKSTWVLDPTKVFPILYHYGTLTISNTAKCTALPSTQLFGVVPPDTNNHTYQVYVQYGRLQSGQEITVTAFDCAGNPDIQYFTLPNVGSYIDYMITTVTSCSEPTSDWSSYYVVDLGPAGSTPEPPAVTLPTGGGIDLTTPPTTIPPVNQLEDLGINLNPLDNIVNETVYDCYLDRSKSTFSKYSGQTNFYLPLQIGNIYDHDPTTANNWEVVDLSDTFIEINYSSTDPDAVVQSGNERIVYKFGGYCIDTVITPNTSKLRYQNEISPGKTLIDYEDDYFYYPIFDTTKKQIVGVLLSSNTFFKLPDNREEWNFRGGYIFGNSSSSGTYISKPIRLHGKDVPITSIQVHKITNYPSCGKVDIYFRKTGKVNGFSYGTIISNGHGLQNNDIIKFTGSLNIDVELAVLQQNGDLIYEESENAYLMMEKINKSLNGIRYAKVIDENRFQIFEDPELTKILTVPFQVSFKSDLRWSCVGNTREVDNQAWKYYSTLYSPHGKNGYGVIETKREIVENQKFKSLTYNHSTTRNPKELIDYADLHTYSLEEGLTPYLNYKRSNSWNNHYPFKRTVDEGSPPYANTNLMVFNMDIKNGNRFGSAVDLVKVTDNEYILLVAEKGASESYKIVNKYALETDVTSWIPFNSRVTPTFLPYGRIHLFKITKNENNRISTIDYMKTVAAEDNPWKPYEVANQLYRQGKVANNRTYSNVNYGILTGNVLKFNDDATDYWKGAKYLHWNKDYGTDIFFTSTPKDEGNESEFGFIDMFGKSISTELRPVSTKSKFNLFELDVIASAESKNIQNSDLRLLFKSLTIPLYVDTYTSISNEIYVPCNLSVAQQKAEARDFGNKIICKNGYVVLGWPSRYKKNGSSLDNYIYIFKKSGASLTLNQTIVRQPMDQSVWINYPTGFGDFLAFDGTYLVTNAEDITGDNYQKLSYITDYIYIYSQGQDGQFKFLQKISPTIDISNEKYANAIYFPVTFESDNLSYQGTRDNSRTYITKLLKRYDIFKGVLVIRDPLEYCVFTYKKLQNKFTPIFTNFVDVDSFELDYNKRIMTPNEETAKYDGLNDKTRTSNCIVKIGESLAPSTFSSAREYDTGQFSPSYQIFEFSQFYKELKTAFGYRGGDDTLKVVQNNPTYTKFNIGTSIDFQNPNYGLPMFIKANEISKGSVNLVNTGHGLKNSGIPMYLRLQIEKNDSGIPLYLKQYDIDKSGINLNIVGSLSNDSTIPLLVDSTVKFVDQNLNLSIYNPIPTTGSSNSLSLSLKNVYQNGLAGFDPENPGDDNWTIGTRNATGVNLFLKGDPYLDHAQKVNLFIGDSSISTTTPKESGEIFDSVQLSIDGQINPDSPNIIHGTTGTQNMNLFLKGSEGGYLNLFVYNTLTSGNLNIITNGAYLSSSGLNLSINGTTKPTGSLTLYTRGFEIYG